jgi:putative peptidoglycan lipid II flippase
MSLFRSESYKQGILVSTGFSFLSKILGFANGIVIAYYFGTQTKTDVYFYAMATISLLVGYINALDQAVLIPEAMRIREQEGVKRSQEFLSTFIYVYAALALIAMAILAINPVAAFIALSRFNGLVLQENIRLLYLMIPLILLVLITNLLVNILASYKFFTLPMVIGMINSCFTLLFVIAFHTKYDILSMGAGICIAYIINVGILFYILKSKVRWNFSSRIYPIGRHTGSRIIYTFFSQITTFLGTFLPFYLISGFSHGIVTAMNYGRNFAQLPEQFITAQVSTVASIKLNELFAKKAYEEINKTFLNTARFLLFIMIPLSALLFLFPKEIIATFYRRGAFDANSVKITAEFLKWFGLALPLTAINMIISRLYMCGQKIKEAFIIGIGINLLYLIVMVVLVKRIGPLGYPISILSYLPLSLFVVYRISTARHFRFIRFDEIIKSFIKTALINLAASIIVFYSATIFENSIARMLVGFVLYTSILVFANWFFCLEPNIKQQTGRLFSLITVYINKNRW